MRQIMSDSIADLSVASCFEIFEILGFPHSSR